MIVVLIIGVIYALVLSNFNTKKNVHILKLTDIKESLLPFWSKGKQIDFYLYSQCQKSAIFINDIYQEEIEPDIKLSEFSKIEVFKPDYRGESKKIEFTPIMINNKLKKVCFRYTLFPNGSSSSFILKQKKLYHIFFPYFQEVNSTQDLGEAIDLLQQKPYRGVMPDEVND